MSILCWTHSPPHFEAVEPLRRFVLGVDVVDLGGSAASLTPVDHLADGVFGPFEDGLDAAVVEVADSAVDARLSCRVSRCRTVVDALDASQDVHVCSCSVGHRERLRAPPS